MLTTWNLSERDECLVRAYMMAKSRVIDNGFADEIDMQEEACLDKVSEQTLLREAAWVILSSGMNERVVRKLFPCVSVAFRGFRSAREISRHREQCRQAALSIFAHEGKIEAILAIAVEIASSGFRQAIRRIKHRGPEYLQKFKYLGPATSRHLAKNLGMNLPKPDRHLVRLAHAAGFSTPDELCSRIANLVGEKLSVVDIVLWRYATLRRDYLLPFKMSRPEM